MPTGYNSAPTVLIELLALKPEQMSIDDHWLKGLYLKNKKTMPEEMAWEAALLELVKQKKRVRNITPQFSREEFQHIMAYKAKNDIPGRSHRPY
jgi:hypothetical protein